MPSERPHVCAAMQTMSVIVPRQLYCVTVKHKTSLIDSVGISAYRCTEIRFVDLWRIGAYTVKTQNYILKLTVLLLQINKNLCLKVNLY